MRGLLVIISLVSFSITAQVNLDSLWGLWSDINQPDSVRFKSINTYAWDGYLFSQPDSAYYYSQMHYDYAKEKNNLSEMGIARNVQAIHYIILGNSDSALTYNLEAIQIFRQIESWDKLTSALTNRASFYSSKGATHEAEEVLKEAIISAQKSGNPEAMAGVESKLGTLRHAQGDYSSAIRHYSKAYKINEQHENLYGMAAKSINLGLIYRQLDEPYKALEYIEKGESLFRKINNLKGLANALTNSGNIYIKIKKYDLAQKKIEESLQLHIKLSDKEGLSDSYYALASLLDAQAKYNDAIEYANKALENGQKHGLPGEITACLNLLGKIYLDKTDFHNALYYSNQALKSAVSYNYRTSESLSYYYLWKSYKGLNRYKESLEMFENYVTLQDSLTSEKNQKAIIRQEYKYQYDKQAAADSIKSAEEAKVKDAQLVAEQAENKQHKLEAKQQEQQKYFLFGGLGLALLFGGFVFNRYRVTNKQKGIIEAQKEQVDTAYDELEEKNTEILDSINYAKRIQSAILPPDKLVKEYLANSFVLYKPKDIVAGDFYWMEPQDGRVLFAAADCTGHGVPGAMVSVVCNNGLNRSVREHGLTEPGQILDKTREIVIGEFEKSEEEVKDGMDVALCSLEGHTLKYAGAHNPLWIIRIGADSIEEVKANKQPIGKYMEPLPYTTHTVELNPGDSFYVFSDGYADQFGGEKGKKFKAANFKRLLLSIQNETMERQRELIDEAFEKWKGTLEQLDDVCVIGVKI